jgi:hypothetical protein
MRSEPCTTCRIRFIYSNLHGLEREMNDVRDMVVEWDYPYISTLRRGYVVELFEKNSLFDDFKAKHWGFGNTRPVRHSVVDFCASNHSTRNSSPAVNRLRNANPRDHQIRKMLLSSRLRPTFGIFWPEISNE